MPVPQPAARIATTVAVLGVASIGGFYLFSPTAFAESLEPPMAFNGGPAFHSLRLHSVKQVNHDTKRLLFELPDPNAKSGLTLTTSLLTISRPQGSYLPVFRPYTPISNLQEPGFLELMVKKYPSGKASTHIHSLTPGQTLLFALPLKGFSWSPNKHPHIYLLAGGAGITPIYQLMQGILQNPADKTKVTLVFGVNAEQDLVLHDEIEGLRTKFPGRLDVVYTVTNVENSSTAGGLRKGRITKALLEEVMQGPREKDAKVFVCGPPAMEAALTGSGGWFGGGGQRGILGELGYRRDQIYKF